MRAMPSPHGQHAAGLAHLDLALVLLDLPLDDVADFRGANLHSLCSSLRRRVARASRRAASTAMRRRRCRARLYRSDRPPAMRAASASQLRAQAAVVDLALDVDHDAAEQLRIDALLGQHRAAGLPRQRRDHALALRRLERRRRGDRARARGRASDRGCAGTGRRCRRADRDGGGRRAGRESCASIGRSLSCSAMVPARPRRAVGGRAADWRAPAAICGSAPSARSTRSSSPVCSSAFCSCATAMIALA